MTWARYAVNVRVEGLTEQAMSDALRLLHAVMCGWNTTCIVERQEPDEFPV